MDGHGDHTGGESDATLAERAAQGDRNAFETLLRRHYDRIHGLAWHVLGSRADADDVAQEVCCTLATRIGSFRGEARFTTWLHGVTVNACRDHRRRRRSFGAMVERVAVLAGLASAPDGRDAYDAAWLKSALARLKPPLPETAALVVGQQLSHAEAADVLGVSEATVSWRMHQIRKKLTGGKAAG